jgi:hypothetical protein
MKKRGRPRKAMAVEQLAAVGVLQDHQFAQHGDHEEQTRKFKNREGGPALRSLAAIRTQALNAHADVAHTIAELEAWRNEIDATLAFLRSTRPA